MNKKTDQDPQKLKQKQEAMVIQHAPLVKRIAYHLMARMPPMVLVDDLIQAGMLGLLDAFRNYDPSRGASFETYAGIRIRGSMLDELRRNDWAPKSVHRKIRDMAKTIREIENQTGRDARDNEIIEAMDISQEDYFKILKEASVFRMTNLEAIGIDEEAISKGMVASEPNPIDTLQEEDFKNNLATSIAALPERERMIVNLYYDAELNLREIGSVLGVSESRTSQLLSQALIRLRARMNNWVA